MQFTCSGAGGAATFHCGKTYDVSDAWLVSCPALVSLLVLILDLIRLGSCLSSVLQ
jgi:hypothetical protein